MDSITLKALDILAPGLPDWPASRAILSGDCRYDGIEQALPAFPASLLPANERRRATRTMKLVLAVAAGALENSGVAPQEVYSVFTSSAGDAEIIDKICTALIQPNRPVSPTQFHNSVHNAPAGYWSIGSGCQQPSISLSAHDGSFSAGLLEAATTAFAEQATVLLVAYDYPPPTPIDGVRYFVAPFATAMVFSPDAAGDRSDGCPRLTLRLVGDADETTLNDPQLERLRTGNPAARSLPLLHALARRESASVVLPYLDDCRLQIDVATGDSQ